MSKFLYVAKIAHSTSADGVGLRNALYVSGCDIKCPGCHNKHLWDIESGVKMSVDDVYDQLNIDDFNISILGGEPLMQYDSIVELCKKIKENTRKDIWLWSGHTFQIIADKFPDILQYVDVIVDGPFIQERYMPNLKWRGSENQSVIILEH